MRYAKIVYNDIVNSNGLALTFYCQGCTHHCPGCFNKSAWPFGGGQPFTDKELMEMRYYLNNYPCDNIVLLGGEPFDNVDLCLIIADLAREYNKKLWCYTGYDLEQLLEKPITSKTGQLLKVIDVLIDGEFREELKMPTLKFRGSLNQCIYKHFKDIDRVTDEVKAEEGDIFTDECGRINNNNGLWVQIMV